jgi:hypothetical protein
VSVRGGAGPARMICWITQYLRAPPPGPGQPWRTPTRAGPGRCRCADPAKLFAVRGHPHDHPAAAVRSIPTYWRPSWSPLKGAFSTCRYKTPSIRSGPRRAEAPPFPLIKDSNSDDHSSRSAQDTDSSLTTGPSGSQQRMPARSKGPRSCPRRAVASTCSPGAAFCYPWTV